MRPTLGGGLPFWEPIRQVPHPAGIPQGWAIEQPCTFRMAPMPHFEFDGFVTIASGRSHDIRALGSPREILVHDSPTWRVHTGVETRRLTSSFWAFADEYSADLTGLVRALQILLVLPRQPHIGYLGSGGLEPLHAMYSVGGWDSVRIEVVGGPVEKLQPLYRIT